MNGHAITRKQFSAAILVSLLSPLLRLLPQEAVKQAGPAAWLAAIPAILPLLFVAVLMEAYRRHMRPGEGMGGLLLRWLGPVFGRLVLVIYGAWFLFYAGFILRIGASRLVDTIYPSSGPELFVLVMLLLCFLASLGSLRAAARTAVIVRGILIGALAVVLLFSLPNVEPKNLLPIGWGDAIPVLRGTWPYATVGAVASCFSFLSGYVEPPKGKYKWMWSALFGIVLLGGIICGEVVSVFGASLSTQLMYPFFVLIRNISILNLVPRIEAVVIAAWVLADFMLCTMLLRCAHEALRSVFNLPVPDDQPMLSLKKGRFLLWLETAAVYGLCFCFELTPDVMQQWSARLIPIISNCLLYGGFLLLWLVTVPRRRKEKAK